MVEKRPSEAGYNLVILMVAMTLLNIALALALPKWSQVIRREREEELISRGFQYAEAIRIFQNRFQRLPVRIEELIEVEPRSIRKLWKDPMTDDGKWVLIPPGGQEGQPLTPQQPGPDGQPQPGEDLDGRGDQDQGDEIDPDGGIGEKKGTVQVGPFSGVHSRSGKESILIFNGRTRYDEWHFTLEMIQQLLGGGAMHAPGQPPPGGNIVGGDPTRLPVLSTRWLGRPLPAFLNPQNGQMPDGQMQPDGRPSQNLGQPKPPARR
jgi:type II secretory pathway pseudopilin PulG